MTDTPSNDESLAELASVPTETEAQLIAQELQRHGVEARTAGGFISGFKAEAPADVKVFVQAADLPKARQCLEKIRTENAAIDWDQIDFGQEQ